MVDDVDLRPAEVKTIQRVVVITLDVLFLKSSGVISEEAVGEVVIDELFIAAKSHNATEEFLVEVDYLPKLL